eukprot:961730_1
MDMSTGSVDDYTDMVTVSHLPLECFPLCICSRIMRVDRFYLVLPCILWFLVFIGHYHHGLFIIKPMTFLITPSSTTPLKPNTMHKLKQPQSLAEDEQFIQRTLLYLFRNKHEWNEFTHTRREQLTRFMTRFIEENQSLSMMQCLKQFFDELYLNMSLNGDTDTNGLNVKINDLIDKSPSQYGVKDKYKDVKHNVLSPMLLQFDPFKNKHLHRFNEDIDIKLYVNVKNITGDIVVKYFEINTVPFYRQNMKALNVNELHLDGLQSKHQHLITLD